MVNALFKSVKLTFVLATYVEEDNVLSDLQSVPILKYAFIVLLFGKTCAHFGRVLDDCSVFFGDIRGS